jgi:membrane-associated protease RseP (regulator of RpoE activity)
MTGGARPMMGLITAAVVVGLLSHAPPEARSRRLEDGKTIVVPFKMLPTNHMVVEAKLNGKGPYRFVFDLGAPVTLLSNSVAEATGAIPKGAPRSFLMSARGEGKVERMEFGELEAEDVPVVVMDHPALRALSGMFSRPLAGIIGYTFWAHYKMTIDYQAKEMTFEPVDFEVRNLMEELPARLAGPKQAKTVVLAPRGIFGLRVGSAEGSRGVSITRVVLGSAAEDAGLREGDLLTTFDGRWTTSVADVYHAAEKVAPGKETAVVVMRAGEEVTLKIRPREGL